MKGKSIFYRWLGRIFWLSAVAVTGYTWYYMDQAGVMQKGWFKDNDKWYFLLPNGAMATNTVIDGRQIGADGVWIAAEGEVEPANITDLSTPYLVQNLLDGLSTKGYNIITSGKTSTGERWNNAIRLKGKGSYVKYAANGQYRLLSGVIAPSSQFSSGIALSLYANSIESLKTRITSRMVFTVSPPVLSNLPASWRYEM